MQQKIFKSFLFLVFTILISSFAEPTGTCTDGDCSLAIDFVVNEDDCMLPDDFFDDPHDVSIGPLSYDEARLSAKGGKNLKRRVSENHFNINKTLMSLIVAGKKALKNQNGFGQKFKLDGVDSNAFAGKTESKDKKINLEKFCMEKTIKEKVLLAFLAAARKIIIQLKSVKDFWKIVF